MCVSKRTVQSPVRSSSLPGMSGSAFVLDVRDAFVALFPQRFEEGTLLAPFARCWNLRCTFPSSLPIFQTLVLLVPGVPGPFHHGPGWVDRRCLYYQGVREREGWNGKDLEREIEAERD